jgi:orotidine-5'-phosphate decarboxylase
VFILVRTSNPSAGRVQDVADAGGDKLYEHVAAMVARLGDGAGLVGERGYSCVGAVVGATYPAEAAALRGLMPRQLFLVPGYGAQGATAEDCRAAFKADGTGAIVNASRSVIYPPDAGDDGRGASREAAQAFAADVARAAKAERRNPSDE